MKLTQLTHHDLDGYGASTVVAAYADVARVIHVSRYSDVGPVVETELARLRKAGQPERLIMTDLGLEPVAVSFIKAFAAMNAKRGAESRHSLVVLDHHASSLDQLAAQGLHPAPAMETAGPHRFVFEGDPAMVVLIDETRCASRIAFEQHALYATRTPDTETTAGLGVLVAAIDVVDLWRKTDPMFRQALVLDEVFWENVSGFVPPAHPWHDRFVGSLLLEMASRLGKGAAPAAIEREVAAIRTGIVDAMLMDAPDDDPALTTRMRLAPMLARSPDLFHRMADGTMLSFGLDGGTFQRVSDAIMASGAATMVINVQRSGAMAFRSNNETALTAARKFNGGGHKDASGGRLMNVSITSLAEAAAQVAAVLDPPKPNVSNSPFAALQGLKT